MCIRDSRKIVRSCCVTAAAYAVACFGKYFDDRGVVLQTENEGIAQLAQKLYALSLIHIWCSAL